VTVNSKERRYQAARIPAAPSQPLNQPLRQFPHQLHSLHRSQSLDSILNGWTQMWSLIHRSLATMKVGQLHLDTTNWHKQSHQLQLWSHPQRCIE